MSDIDYEQIIWRSQNYENDTHQPHRLLTARVRELCPDCEGTGDRMHNGECIGACGHPNAPTIAKLLAIGAAVMTATWGSMPHADGQEHLSVTLANGKTHRYAWLMLDDLKAVQ